MTHLNVYNILRNKTFRQTSTLFGSGIFLTFLTVITTPITTRTLGPVDFSVMKLFLAITKFAILFFNFGFAYTASVLLAKQNSEDEQRQMIGASLLISLFIGLLYALFLLQFSYYADSIFNNTTIGIYLRLVIPFFIFYPVQILIQEVGRGTNRIDSMVMGKNIPFIIRFFSIIILWYMKKLSLVSLIYVEAVLAIVPVIVLLRYFKPSFRGFAGTFRTIFSKNRSIGFPMYVSNTTSQSTYQLDGIMITMFADTVQLGYYFLANVFAETINSFSQALSSSKYRDFANNSSISSRVLLTNYGIIGLGAVSTIILGKLIIRIVAGPEYNVPFGLILPVGILGFVHGAYQPYYNFLHAKGKGTLIRNVGFITAGMNVIGNILLIPFWGAIGAAWASVLSKGVTYMACLYYYRREKG